MSVALATVLEMSYLTLRPNTEGSVTRNVATSALVSAANPPCGVCRLE